MERLGSHHLTEVEHHLGTGKGVQVALDSHLVRAA